MYTGLLHAHSGLRWIVFTLLIIAAAKSLMGWLNKKEYNKSDNLMAILLIAFTHIQFVMGLTIYFMSGKLAIIGEAMKSADTRFWAVEHGLTMIIAIVLITLGRVISKKTSDKILKHKKGAIFYLIAFVLILWAGVIKPYLLKGTLF